MVLDPTLEDALEGDVVTLFFAVEIQHPFKTIRLLDGLGFLVISGQTFVGHDPDIGSLKAVDFTEDGIGEEAPECQITISQVSSSAAISLSAFNSQGSIVKVWLGSYSTQTGLVLGSPDLRFVGKIDVPNPNFTDAEAGIVFDCVAGFEAFFEVDEGLRFNNSFLQTVTPGDLAAEYISDVELEIPWGSEGARPALSRDTIRNTIRNNLGFG